MKTKINVLLITVILPVIFSIITNFGYVSTYTTEVFSKETFKEQYDRSVYKYRILTKPLLLETDKILSQTKLNSLGLFYQRIVKFLDDKGLFSFYFSYFVINTFFSVLSVIFFYLICSNFIFKNEIKKTYLAAIIFSAIIPLFQYVVVPYDYASYFFNNLIVFLFLMYQKKKSLLLMFLLILSVFLATLNRESSALAIACILVLSYSKTKNPYKSLKEISLPIITFLLTYFGLRFVFGFDSGIIENFKLHLNFISPLNLFGIFTFISGIYLIYIFSETQNVKKYLNIFIYLSAPYILVSFLGGVTFEIRLWTPLLINLSILLIYFNRENTHGYL